MRFLYILFLVITLNLFADESWLFSQFNGHGRKTNSYEISETLSDREKYLIDHVKRSIFKASAKESDLSNEVLNIDGMSSSRNRHLLNNLCKMPNTNYLEIGLWKGSTFVSALYNNEKTVNKAIGIDNWSLFKGSMQEMHKNYEAFIAYPQVKIYDEDCFKIDLSSLTDEPINIYFYDGAHKEEDQREAFVYYNSILDESFIAIVDDWNFPEVRRGTYKAFKELNYKVLYETSLPASLNGDTKLWWNGFYVAVIRKS